jgi:hypothetical protein
MDGTQGRWSIRYNNERPPFLVIFLCTGKLYIWVKWAPNLASFAAAFWRLRTYARYWSNSEIFALSRRQIWPALGLVQRDMHQMLVLAIGSTSPEPTYSGEQLLGLLGPKEKSRFEHQILRLKIELEKIGKRHLEMQALPISKPDPQPRRQIKSYGKAN